MIQEVPSTSTLKGVHLLIFGHLLYAHICNQLHTFMTLALACEVIIKGFLANKTYMQGVIPPVGVVVSPYSLFFCLTLYPKLGNFRDQ